MPDNYPSFEIILMVSTKDLVQQRLYLVSYDGEMRLWDYEMMYQPLCAPPTHHVSGNDDGELALMEFNRLSLAQASRIDLERRTIDEAMMDDEDIPPRDLLLDFDMVEGMRWTNNLLAEFNRNA